MHGGAVVSAVASQQEGPGFESRTFCVELACSPRVCVGFLRVLWFPPTSKDMHSILLSLPRDQGTGIRTGVGPRALHCGCPLFLTSLGWVSLGWVKCRGQISPPGLIKYDLWFIYDLWFMLLISVKDFIFLRNIAILLEEVNAVNDTFPKIIVSNTRVSVVLSSDK